MAPSQPNLSSQSALSSQPALSSELSLSTQPGLSSQQALPITAMPEQTTATSVCTSQKPETSDALEQAERCEQLATAPSATTELQPELSQPHSKSEKEGISLLHSTVVPSELVQPPPESVQAEDKSPSNAPSSSLPSLPPSTAQKAEKPLATPEAHVSSSGATTDTCTSIPQSESSTQPSKATVSKVSFVSSQTPIDSPTSAQASQTCQPSSDLAKSRQPLQSPRPSLSESRSTLDAEDAYSSTVLSKPPQGSKESIDVDKAPPTGVDVGVAKAEPAQDSSTGLNNVAVTVGGGTEGNKASSLAEEELLRLMHPSIVAG